MKHKWKLKTYGKRSYNFSSNRRFVKITKIYECVNCSLLKGNCRDFGFFPMLVFFNKNEVLSKGRVPFECQGSVFIEEAEFKI